MATTTTTAPTTSSVPAAASTTLKMDFRQLEDQINKWTNELDEQEGLFMNQALKINYWDKTLMINGEKITKLAADMDKLKGDHKRAEASIENIKQKQRSFEGFIESVEAVIPTNYAVIPERVEMYNKIENIDTQLQQMGEDLREVVRHINDSNRVFNKEDHISQILKILNEHTDSLQWVGKTIEEVKTSLDDVGKAHKALKQNHEQSIRSLFQR